MKKTILFLLLTSNAFAQDDPFQAIKERSKQNYHMSGTYKKEVFDMLDDNKKMIRLIDSYELMNLTFMEVGCVEKDYKQQIYKAVFTK